MLNARPSASRSPRGRHAGFTLIELMVGVAIMAVLLVVGVPSFQSAIASNRLTSSTNDMVSALALARTEAIRRGVRVTVCKSANTTQCTTAGNWAQGWIIFVDTTRSTTNAAVDSGETILASNAATTTNIVMVGSGGVPNFVSFSADGQAKLMNGSAQSGVLRICSTSGALANNGRARDIAVAAAGRVATTTPSSVAATCPAS
ncbi:MAG: GspH/FimT family pseudopilin [Hydrogenophaga sp.]|nr:GspH/FimT family pseudopilin [Hydrogenophaga sp.]MDO9434349.1 GspH/FimT family pseudopilin [Hydrogenophaga sp.]